MSDHKSAPPTDVRPGEKHLLLDHNYDGIQELDHMLPRWWVWLFYATIVFAAWYVGVYMSGYGATPQQELASSLKEIAALHPLQTPTPGGDPELVGALGNPEKIAHGREVFQGKCVACHGDAGQGLIGPNLTDDFWIHGKGQPQDIATVVANGVAEKGMPPWGQILTVAESRDVVVYIHSLHDTHPAGAKPPQGEKYEYEK